MHDELHHQRLRSRAMVLVRRSRDYDQRGASLMRSFHHAKKEWGESTYRLQGQIRDGALVCLLLVTSVRRA